ncbi:c-type cytochrome domain-containing protein [Candidatus Rariloculus sp.]|uniref:c-type cytochrome domain-containing protein n=1 Tax=Candidatus Rariloculus sp. TaxID=3101265 RepID=UPI003D0A3100
MSFIYFLGRFHVLVLHVPIGIIVAIVVLEALARREKYRNLEAASPFLWGAAALTAIVTVVLGYFHFAEGSFGSASGVQHRTFGTALGVLITAVALLRLSRFARNYAPVYFPASVLMVLLVSITGHYGGNLTHGSSYLVEYAPQPVRSLAGLGPRRPPVTDLALADPFLDIVGPILRQRCTSCHGTDTTEADLNMTTYEGVMRGGETGGTIAAGRPEFSELMNRITLPPDDEAFMPAEGNTPPTPEQVRIIEWWIQTGAQSGVVLGESDIEVSAEIEALLRAELGL